MPRKKSKLEDRLIVKKESTWKKMSESERRRVFRYAERYKSFLSKAKTERKAVEEIVSAAEKERYVDLYSAERVKAGSGLLAVNKNKNVDLFVVGKKPIMEGMNIIASHIDAPRLDLNQNPLYEASDSKSLSSRHTTTVALRNINGSTGHWRYTEE